jgi:sulfur carrier protein ThiS
LAGYIIVRILPENRFAKIHVDECVTVAELLSRLGLSRESGVAVKNGDVLPEWAKVCPGEEVDLYLAVSSG